MIPGDGETVTGRVAPYCMPDRQGRCCHTPAISFLIVHGSKINP